MKRGFLREILEDVAQGKDLVTIFTAQGRSPAQVWEALGLLVSMEDSSLFRKVASRHRVDPSYLLHRIQGLIHQMENLREEDPYSLLGVEYTASPAEIHQKWKELMQEWHPDRRGGDPRAQEMCRRINEAYELLKDRERRREYDRKFVPFLAILRGLKKSPPRKAGGFSWKRGFLPGVLVVLVMLGVGLYLFRVPGPRPPEGKGERKGGRVSIPLYKGGKESRGASPEASLPRGHTGNPLPGRVSLQGPSPPEKGPRVVARVSPGLPLKVVVPSPGKGISQPPEASAGEMKGKKVTMERVSGRRRPQRMEARRSVAGVKRPARKRVKVASGGNTRTAPCKGSSPGKGLARKAPSPLTRVIRPRASPDPSTVVARFIRAYQEEDLDGLLSLFSPNALENGQPLTRYIARYRQFFSAFRILDYRLMEEKVVSGGDRVKVQGLYLVSMVPRSGGNIHWVKGSVAWTLVKATDGRWLIDSLDYTME